jgi:hypothetical protein
MERFARVVLGYHGCRASVAADLLNGKLSIAEWTPSENAHDWLGHGVYFWEHSPERAIDWARGKVARDGVGEEPAVVGAVIQLGACLDLTNVAYTAMLRQAYDHVRESYERAGRPLPTNTGRDRDLKNRQLDCLVINHLHEESGHAGFETVRGVFLEGGPAYPGAKGCILGVFRPNMVWCWTTRKSSSPRSWRASSGPGAWIRWSGSTRWSSSA